MSGLDTTGEAGELLQPLNIPAHKIAANSILLCCLFKKSTLLTLLQKKYNIKCYYIQPFLTEMTKTYIL